MKQILFALFVQFFVQIHAETNVFATFLSKMEEVTIPNDSVFGESAWNKHVRLNDFPQYLPMQDDACGCEGNVYWMGCGYMKMGNYILAFLRRGCSEFCENRFKRWLMEDTGSDKFFVMYSTDGKLLDYRDVARDAYCYFDSISYDSHSRSFIVERGELEEPSNWHTFDDHVYITTKHRYSFTKTGIIRDKLLEKSIRRIVPNKQKIRSSDLTFSQFLSRFRKWDKPYVDGTIYECKEDAGRGLPGYFMYKLVPDSVDCQCWPLDMDWNAYYYVETESNYLCFVDEVCNFPTAEEGMFTNYFMFIFSKQGFFEHVVKVARNSDDDNYSSADFFALLTKRLRMFLKQKK